MQPDDLTTLTDIVEAHYTALLYELFGSVVLQHEELAKVREVVPHRSERFGSRLLVIAAQLGTVAPDTAAAAQIGELLDDALLDRGNRDVIQAVRDRLVIGVRAARMTTVQALTEAWLTTEGQNAEARLKFLRTEVAPRTSMEALRAFARLVSCEVWSAHEAGRAKMIVEQTGVADPYVCKIGSAECCVYCEHLYGGNKPKAFLLSELRQNGNNYARRARIEVVRGEAVADEQDWRPTLCAAHDWCQCALALAPRQEPTAA